jgi:sugar-specific transcriptional regulator TrmB
MYTELLEKLGFDEKEIAVFIAVLERGRVAPAVVATITGINRSTVYSVAKSLAERGVLYIDSASEPAYLVVESGDALENLISKQEIKLNKERKIVAETIKLLESIPKSKNYSVPKIRFYNERELETALHERTKY